MKLMNNHAPYREPIWQSPFVAELELPNSIVVDEKWMTVACYKASLPNISNEQVEMHYLNTKFYFASGDYSLDDLTLGFNNFNIGEKSARSILYEWSKLKINHETGTRGYAGSGLGANDGYKTTARVYELNNDGTSIHTVWIFVGVFPKATGNSEKSWESKGEYDKSDIAFRYDTFYRIGIETPHIGKNTWQSQPEPID